MTTNKTSEVVDELLARNFIDVDIGDKKKEIDPILKKYKKMEEALEIWEQECVLTQEHCPIPFKSEMYIMTQEALSYDPLDE